MYHFTEVQNSTSDSTIGTYIFVIPYLELGIFRKVPVPGSFDITYKE
jgi:hypothetical protein